MPYRSKNLQSSLIETLYRGQPLRLWSFVVSIFGELGGSANHEISGALLGTLVSKIGSKPEALRVALHRLKKSGWIKSVRNGRQSRYSLTELAHKETLDAYPAIYSSLPCASKAWLVVSSNRNVKQDSSIFSIALSSNIWVSDIPIESETTWSIALQKNDFIPQWVSEKLCPTELVRRCRDLHDLLKAHPIDKDLDIIDQALLRILIVHSWRRIILKQPRLPKSVFPLDWKGEQCRDLVLGRLNSLPPVELDKLEAELT